MAVGGHRLLWLDAYAALRVLSASTGASRLRASACLWAGSSELGPQDFSVS